MDPRSPWKANGARHRIVWQMQPVPRIHFKVGKPATPICGSVSGIMTTSRLAVTCPDCIAGDPDQTPVPVLGR